VHRRSALAAALFFGLSAAVAHADSPSHIVKAMTFPPGDDVPPQTEFAPDTPKIGLGLLLRDFKAVMDARGMKCRAPGARPTRDEFDAPAPPSPSWPASICKNAYIPVRASRVMEDQYRILCRFSGPAGSPVRSEVSRSLPPEQEFVHVTRERLAGRQEFFSVHPI
jgi:hypothetical protein